MADRLDRQYHDLDADEAGETSEGTEAAMSTDEPMNETSE